MRHKQTVLIIDYGSQYTQLIARRIRSSLFTLRYFRILSKRMKSFNALLQQLYYPADRIVSMPRAHLSSILPLWKWVSLSSVSATDLDSS